MPHSRSADHVAYFKRLLQHKLRVLEEGRQLGVPTLRLLLHDWSKFMPDEWRAGVAFHRDGTGNDEALRKHYARNRHHPQWWLRDGKPLPMDDVFRREMLADWRAMAREKGGKVTDWYAKSGHSFPFHADTRIWIENELFGQTLSDFRRETRKRAEPLERPNEL